MSTPPCLIFEDEHLLVVHKPAGLNTHAPAPHAGEGLYDWLRHREPRWARLAIIHRLDKETSGVMVFGKTTAANRSLTEQFTQHTITKKYVLLTDRAVKETEFTVTTPLARAGERYASQPGGERAETRFHALTGGNDFGNELLSHPSDTSPLNRKVGRVTPGAPASGAATPGAHGVTRLTNPKPPHGGGYTLLEAEPVTGRTHQIRVHAAERGFPILGDALYGGSPFPRVCLHARALTLRHPISGETMTFEAPADFHADGRLALRHALVEPEATDAFRLLHGAADGWPGWYVERLGAWLLSQAERPLREEQQQLLAAWREEFQLAGAFHKLLDRQVRRAQPEQVSPQPVFGEAAPEEVVVRENGVSFALRFNEGYSVGLFLDQRDNRRRVLTGHVAAGFELGGKRGDEAMESWSAAAADSTTPPTRPEVLNTFAYTCAFSVCAARTGARVTSVDLSKKYLEWGRRNFALNGLDATAHEFLFGDVFDWLRRLAKKQRRFDLVLLDPPTFSRSKEHGVFQAEKDFGELVAAALPLVKPEGVLFCSTNAATLEPEKFLELISTAAARAQRTIRQQHYVPQPPDFPVTRAEPAYLKTVWLRME